MTLTNGTAIEQWGLFELSLQGSAEGNPYLEEDFKALFSYQHRTIEVDGFYDGDGVYRVRFMPDTQGNWHYRTQSKQDALNGVEGSFECVAPGPGNHGPVRVANTHHFAYADGTPYKQVGTTVYALAHQDNELEEQTLATLRTTPFNKLRMLVFPKYYIPYVQNEPERYPFPCLSRGVSTWPMPRLWKGEKPEGWSFDFSRFEPAFFQHIERRIADLLTLGIEADLILFHTYDRWGFSLLDAQTDDRYLRYVVARFSAYRNVWWSIANEYDLMKSKTMTDWDRFFRILQEKDPYQHLRSVHNWTDFYDHAKPWVTHLSVQSSKLEKTRTWREHYRKPVIVDECCYEGNLAEDWGNISGRELVHRFWAGTVRGGYVGHGDTFQHPQHIIWWTKGGVLRGESAPRLAFLRRLLEEGPESGLDPIEGVTSWGEFGAPCAGQPHSYYLAYFGVHQPIETMAGLPEGEQYRGEVIDTWEMTVTPLEEPVERDKKIPLPGKPYQALILRRIS
jgi:hypothetical protein